jgi:diguanylate cyclase (GGDEF)-like protein
LVEAAQHLRDAVRPGDSVARIGGDEFAVLCEDVGADQTAQIVRRIQEAMNAPTSIDDETSVTGSIGAVVYQPRPSHAAPRPEELLHDADTAMYQAKADRKNRSRGRAGPRTNPLERSRDPNGEKPLTIVTGHR